ncbi:MAG: YncE family protein [Roseovarius sp.]
MRRALELLAICLATPAAGQTAYVTCQPADAVSVIDVSRGTEVDRWDVAGKPAGIAVGGDAVYSVSPESKTVRRYSPTGRLLTEAVLEGGPTGVALDAARGRLFVSDWYNARLWALDAASLEILQELETGSEPAGIALSPDGSLLATAEKDADRVSIFDAQTLEVLHRVKVGMRPYGLGFAPDGRLFVGNVGSNDVTVLDAVAGTVLATVPVGERPYGVAFAAGRAFVTNQYANSLSVIDLKTLAQPEEVGVGEYPEGIDATADGAQVVFANWFDNTVTVMDAKTLDVVYDIDTCDGPRAFGVFLSGGDWE